MGLDIFVYIFSRLGILVLVCKIRLNKFSAVVQHFCAAFVGEGALLMKASTIILHVPLQLDVATDGGILVDRQMRSSLAGVYAAGDVCTAGWEPAELWFQRRLWTQARQMGHWAGTCMAAHWSGSPDPLADARFDLFSHVTRFFGYRVRSPLIMASSSALQGL